MSDNLPRLNDGKLARYTSLGCYPLMYVTHCGDVLCAQCANDEETDTGRPFDGAADANWEDPALFCDSCGERIESAYAEDDAN